MKKPPLTEAQEEERKKFKRERERKMPLSEDAILSLLEASDPEFSPTVEREFEVTLAACLLHNVLVSVRKLNFLRIVNVNKTRVIMG